jgi:hypothetical protein
MLQVTEDAACIQDAPDLHTVAVSFVLQVVNRKARHHRVERPKSRERVREVVRHDLDKHGVPEPAPKAVQHVRREIERNTDSLWSSVQHEFQQTPVSRAEVQDP